jgi:hypothetical protein
LQINALLMIMRIIYFFKHNTSVQATLIKEIIFYHEIHGGSLGSIIRFASDLCRSTEAAGAGGEDHTGLHLTT